MKFREWLMIEAMVSNIIDAGPDGVFLKLDGKKFGPLADLRQHGQQWVATKMGNPAGVVVDIDPRIAQPLVAKYNQLKAQQQQQKAAKHIDNQRGWNMTDDEMQGAWKAHRRETVTKTLYRGLAGKYRPYDPEQGDAYNKDQSFSISIKGAWDYANRVSKNAKRKGLDLPPTVIMIQIPMVKLPAPHNTAGTIFDIPAEDVARYGVRELSPPEIQQHLSTDRGAWTGGGD